MKEKLPTIHVYLYGMLKRQTKGNIVKIENIHPVIKWFIRIPKKYHGEILKDLVKDKLLKKINRDNYMILTRPDILPIPSDHLGEPLW